MSPYRGYLIETFVTLVGVCALAVVVLWAARRLGVTRSSGPIELRGYLPLDSRRSIALVKVGATVFVVGVGEGGFTKLGELPDADLPASRRPPALTFAQAFARIRGSVQDLGVKNTAAEQGVQARGATRPLRADPQIADPADEA